MRKRNKMSTVQLFTFTQAVHTSLILIETLSKENVGCHGRSPEVIFHLSSEVAMVTPSVSDVASRRQRSIT